MIAIHKQGSYQINSLMHKHIIQSNIAYKECNSKPGQLWLCESDFHFPYVKATITNPSPWVKSKQCQTASFHLHKVSSHANQSFYQPHTSIISFIPQL